MGERASLERVRITRVGLVFVGLAIVVGLAAANTGNNALYMVEAVLLSLLVVSGLASRRNLYRMRVELSLPGEVFANQPFSLAYRLVSLDRWFVKRWLAVSVADFGEAQLVPLLGRRESREGRLAMLVKRRGLKRLRWVRISSIFPLGLFVKVMRYHADAELLVYPEIYPLSVDPRPRPGQSGDEPSRRRGWGQELLSLRRFRSGDDPRGIHWKQSARTGRLVFMERENDEGRRLSILLDNGVGELADKIEAKRFERLVSEAASAAVHYLARGFEVEVVTRGGGVGFGRGRSHRLRVLEALALLEPCAPGRSQLRSAVLGAPELRLGFAPAAAEATAVAGVEAAP